jgi:hypothetical protein
MVTVGDVQAYATIEGLAQAGYLSMAAVIVVLR